ncbi:MAG: hypothetical protein ACRC2T_03655, partial [Thermoguttaceae bacterium]
MLKPILFNGNKVTSLRLGKKGRLPFLASETSEKEPTNVRRSTSREAHCHTVLRYCFLISLFFLVVSVMVLQPVPAASETAPGKIQLDELCVGVDGYYKNGFWTPITITWSSEGDDYAKINAIGVQTTDSDGTPILYSKENISTNQNANTSSGESGSNASNKRTETIYVKLGRDTGAITVGLTESSLDNTTALFKKTFKPLFSEIRGGKRAFSTSESNELFLSPVPVDRPLILVVGDSDVGVQEAISQLLLPENRRPFVVVVDSFDKLPANRLAYEAFEMVVLTTSKPEIWHTANNNSPQITAIYEWLSLGGKVVFAAGKDSEPFLNNPRGALLPFLPGKFERMTALRQGKPLEIYCNGNKSIYMDGSEVAPFIAMPFISKSTSGSDGIIELAEGDLPIIVRKPVGFGVLTYFGGDLHDAPLSDWRERGLFIFKLLAWNVSKGTASKNLSLVHLGYNDMSGQIRSSLDSFDNMFTPPFSLILLLMVIYVLLIGPLDWFLVNRVIKKPRLTWVTFPVW